MSTGKKVPVRVRDSQRQRINMKMAYTCVERPGEIRTCSIVNGKKTYVKWKNDGHVGGNTPTVNALIAATSNTERKSPGATYVESHTKRTPKALFVEECKQKWKSANMNPIQLGSMCEKFWTQEEMLRSMQAKK